MRYLTVALYHPSVMKGGAQYVAKDLHDTARADPDVEAVLLAGFDSQSYPQYAKTGASITGLPDGDGEYLLVGSRFDDFYHLIYDQRRNKAVRRFLEEFRPDVIHMHHSLWIGLEFLTLARKVLPDVRIIYTLHEYMAICYERGQLYRYHERGICQNSAPDQCVKCFPDRSIEEFILRRRTFREAFELVDHFIAPSVYLRDRFVRWGIPAGKISVVPNGHRRQRPDIWTPKPSAELNRFGFFGQFIDAKGIDILLEAAVEVAKERELEVLLFGGNKEFASASYRDRIDRILADAPPGLTITEFGDYSRDNVFDLMCWIDWLVVPSVWPETFGLVISEAWDARRPVIGSATGGIGNRIVDGVNGLTVAPGSAAQLANVMETCIGNEALWNKLSQGISDEISVEEAWSRHKDIVAAMETRGPVRAAR